jgi:hypothetical protein
MAADAYVTAFRAAIERQHRQRRRWPWRRYECVCGEPLPCTMRREALATLALLERDTHDDA